MSHSFTARGRQWWHPGCLLGAFLAMSVFSNSLGQCPPDTAARPASNAGDCAALLPAIDASSTARAVGDVRRKRALLVGISKYATLGGKNGTWKSLPTECDVELMRQVLIARFGFKEGEIRTLTEGAATKDGIKQAFQEHLIDGADRKDVAVFYFSGHGALVPDPEAFGGLRGSLVTANYTKGVGKAGYDDNLRSDEVRELLRALKAKMKGPDGKVDGNITVLFDSCHSGGSTKGELEAKGRSWDPAIDGPIPQPKQGLGSKGDAGAKGFGDFDRDAAIAEGYVFISGCRSYEVAYCPQRDTQASIFTFNLARRLASATPETTYRDLFEPLCSDITSGQVPQLEGDSTKKLLSGVAVDGDRYLVIKAVDGKKVTLPVGFVHGITAGSRYALFRAGKKVNVETNKLGEAKIVDLGITSSVADFSALGAAEVNAEDLKAARAVEVERAFGANPLHVLFEGVDRPDALLKEYAIIDSLDEKGRPVVKETYDILVRYAGTLDPASGRESLVDRKTGKEVLAPADGEYKPQKDKIWVQARSGDVLDVLPANAPPEAIVEALVGQWQKRYVVDVLRRNFDKNQEINVKLIVECVTVTKNAGGAITKIEVLKKIPTDGTMQIHGGDRIRISVQNLSTVPVFVTVLLINREGMQPLYPMGDAPPFRLEPNTPPSAIPGVYRMEEPYGTDLYKVIATRDEASFSGLLVRQRLPAGLGGKGDANVKDAAAIALLPRQVHPLAQLLRAVADGAKGPRREIIGTEWATAEKSIEVLPPTPQR